MVGHSWNCINVGNLTCIVVDVKSNTLSSPVGECAVGSICRLPCDAKSESILHYTVDSRCSYPSYGTCECEGIFQ